MSEVSLLMTTNRKFYVQGDVDDIIYQIQHETTDSQTGRPSKWFYFHRLVKGRVINKHQSHSCYVLAYEYIPCWEVSEKTAVKKTAIKSVVGINSDWEILTPEEIMLIGRETMTKEETDDE